MKVLVVGSGGREHAIGWKLSQSSGVDALRFAPGNAGTAGLGRNIALAASDIAGIVDFVRSEGVGLVIIGPELPLSLGLADALHALPPRFRPLCFGPTQAAARIESSKAFAKDFMVRHSIPTADFRIFSVLEPALDFIRNAPWPFVIKASGLASGKGVFIPESGSEAEDVLISLLGEGVLGQAGREVVIEERLEGEELSLLCFSDGKNISLMPPAQDHKRLFEGDRGPNTGGMGAIASASPESMAFAENLGARFLAPAIAGLAAQGSPFVGALYAGLIFTGSGPKVLEYNCRFGDPEAEAIIPLLESDLASILAACAEGELATHPATWKPLAAAAAFAVSETYAIQSEDPHSRAFADYGLPRGSLLFHGSTRLSDSGPIASGGRLLCAAASAPRLEEALDLAYSRLARLDLPHSRWRKDLGSGRSILRSGARDVPGSPPPHAALSYAGSGVDI
ncbi:MAG TPA: phosphoribosylamine--glycine ligase, partial [Rectinemataceae bacterium]